MKICLFDSIGFQRCLVISGWRTSFAFFPARWGAPICFVFGTRNSPDKAYCWFIGSISLIIEVDKSKRERGKEVDHRYWGKGL